MYLLSSYLAWILFNFNFNYSFALIFVTLSLMSMNPGRSKKNVCVQIWEMDEWLLDHFDPSPIPLHSPLPQVPDSEWGYKYPLYHILQGCTQTYPLDRCWISPLPEATQFHTNYSGFSFGQVNVTLLIKWMLRYRIVIADDLIIIKLVNMIF